MRSNLINKYRQYIKQQVSIDYLHYDNKYQIIKYLRNNYGYENSYNDSVSFTINIESSINSVCNQYNQLNISKYNADIINYIVKLINKLG